MRRLALPVVRALMFVDAWSGALGEPAGEGQPGAQEELATAALRQAADGRLTLWAGEAEVRRQ